MFPIICIGGPTGAGKDTILSAFLEQHPDFVRVPRSTTRPRRENELEGIDYNFLSKETFSELRSRNIICATDYFCGHWYGINFDLMAGQLLQNKCIIGVFGVCAYPLRRIYEKNVYLIYISAPLPTLEKRLLQRGDPQREVDQRIFAAGRQLELEPNNFDYVLNNTGSVTEAVAELTQVINQLKTTKTQRQISECRLLQSV